MITIDASMGEGGGQIVRSSLALSAITGQAVHLTNIRAGRKKPGLMRQHLTAVTAAAQICGGHVDGASVGATKIRFTPGSIRAGEYTFRIGTAGSANLVLQTVMPVLLFADGPSQIVVEGGTHNVSAPPWDFLEQAYFPALAAMGHCVGGGLQAYGFYPAGGGCVRVAIDPALPSTLTPLDWQSRGALRTIEATAMIAKLPIDIANRELATLKNKLGLTDDQLHIAEKSSVGPGNMLSVMLNYEHARAMFCGFGQRGVSAERVAGGLAQKVVHFKNTDVAVTEHLADQLILPMALGAGGVFTTQRPSAHFTTHAEVIDRFLGPVVRTEDIGEGAFRVRVTPNS